MKAKDTIKKWFKENTNKVKLILLIVTFALALTSDLVFGNIETAKLYATGVFISGLSGIFYTVFVMIVIFDLCRLFFIKMISNIPIELLEEEKKTTRTKRK